MALIGEEEGKRIRKKLTDLGLYAQYDMPDIVLEDGKITYGFGFPIKAMEKFLGYYDPAMHLPFSPSISFNTDFSYAFSLCRFKKEPGRDTVQVNGRVSQEYTHKAGQALDLFKQLTGITGSFDFYIDIIRRYGRAKGLSESSAVASSVSMALLRNVLSTEPSETLISRFAKFVSGSGTRSAVTGLSMWLSYAGIAEPESFAVRLPIDLSNLHIAAFPLTADIKTSDMHTAALRSPLYFSWISSKFGFIENFIDSHFPLEMILERGFDEMISLSNVVRSVGREIHNSSTLTIIERYLDFKKKNPNIFMTTDTGPSAVLMSTEKSILLEFLETIPLKYIQGNVNPSMQAQTIKSTLKDMKERYGLQ